MAQTKRLEFHRPTVVHKQFSISPDVFAEPIGSETVLVHLDNDRIYELNVTASRVWQLLQSGLARDGIAEQIMGEFDVEEAQLIAELDSFVEDLVRDGLIRERQG